MAKVATAKRPSGLAQISPDSERRICKIYLFVTKSLYQLQTGNAHKKIGIKSVPLGGTGQGVYCAAVLGICGA